MLLFVNDDGLASVYGRFFLNGNYFLFYFMSLTVFASCFVVEAAVETFRVLTALASAVVGACAVLTPFFFPAYSLGMAVVEAFSTQIWFSLVFNNSGELRFSWNVQVLWQFS